jgi:hypothetical protein
MSSDYRVSKSLKRDRHFNAFDFWWRNERSKVISLRQTSWTKGATAVVPLSLLYTPSRLIPPFELVCRFKMESRKRVGSETSVASSSRPAKRIATEGDQIPIHTDAFSYDDMSFIHDFRKEAIYRGLLVERREAERLKERLKHAQFHDDHIRSINVWLKQLLEELAVSYGQYDPTKEGGNSLNLYVRSLTLSSFEFNAAFCSIARQREIRSSFTSTSSTNHRNRQILLSETVCFESIRL